MGWYPRPCPCIWRVGAVCVLVVGEVVCWVTVLIVGEVEVLEVLGLGVERE
jgi:hypothetical protein